MSFWQQCLRVQYKTKVLTDTLVEAWLAAGFYGLPEGSPVNIFVLAMGMATCRRYAGHF
jgi:hypothetical protein